MPCGYRADSPGIGSYHGRPIPDKRHCFCFLQTGMGHGSDLVRMRPNLLVFPGLQAARLRITAPVGARLTLTYVGWRRNGSRNSICLMLGLETLSLCGLYGRTPVLSGSNGIKDPHGC